MTAHTGVPVRLKTGSLRLRGSEVAASVMCCSMRQRSALVIRSPSLQLSDLIVSCFLYCGRCLLSCCLTAVLRLSHLSHPFTVLDRNCYLVEKSSLPTLSSPLFIHILSNGNRKRTSGLGGVDSFFWILRSFFSSLEGENCHRSLTTGFAGFFRRLDFASMIRTRR